MTLIAVPIRSPEGMSSMVFEHFGRCEFFALLDDKEDKIVSVNVIQNLPSEQDQKKPAAFLVDQEVEIVLAGLIGPCEYGVLLDKNVRIFKGAEGTVKDAYDGYKAGRLIEVKKNRYSL